MRVTQHPSLKTFNTFGVEASAGSLIILEAEEDLLSLPPFDPERDLVLGGGSNILLVSDVPGTVWHNRLTGKEIVERRDGHAWVEAGAGESWHDLVRWSLDQGLSGLENLSLIPGLAGAAPIQNIGAYGVELASVLENVTAWDLVRNCWASFDLQGCELAYRDSRFKSAEPGRYLVTSVRLRLDTRFEPKLDYAGLREELARSGVEKPTALDVSNAVVRLRRDKLPDPEILGNAGSFFKNPVLSLNDAAMLTGRFPDLPAWPQPGGQIKVSAAWMIEHCGLKGLREGDAGVSDRHALVLINHGSASGQDILRLSVKVQTTVYSEFGVLLEPEPRIINFAL